EHQPHDASSGNPVDSVDQPMTEASPPPLVTASIADGGSAATAATTEASTPCESVPMEQSSSSVALAESSSRPAGSEEPIAGSSSGASTATQPELTPELRAILGDIQIPEGIDPSYLAALPEDI